MNILYVTVVIVAALLFMVGIPALIPGIILILAGVVGVILAPPKNQEVRH